MQTRPQAGDQTVEGDGPRQDAIAAAFMNAPVGLGVVDAALRYVWVNATLAVIADRDVDDCLGMTVRELVPHLADEVEPLYRQVFATGAPVVDHALAGRVGAVDDRHFVVSYYPVTDAGATARVGVVVQDVTARRNAEADAAEATQRLAFIARASEVLSSSLDYRRTLARLAELIVPALGDWCAIDVVDDDDRRTHQIVVAHADPAKIDLAEELQRRWPPDADSPTGAPNVVRTGQAELYEDIPDELLTTAARDEEHLASLRALGLRSSVVLPLNARHKTLGAVTLVHAESGRRFTTGDLPFLEDLARRAGVAIDNARLFRDRSHVARALQQSLLPPDLPDIAGLDLAETYRPMSEASEIGGDFYDVFETADGGWTICVGDVEGKGPEAAAITGLARHAIRAAAVHERSPARILSLLNEVLVHDREVPRFCTVAVGHLTVADDRARLRLASAGHPAPIVVRADGEVAPVEISGTLLGLFDAPTLAEATVDLGPGDALVLYTDGVTEARRGGEVFGDDRLADVLRANAGATARTIANRVEAAVLAWQPEHREDDLAILVLRMVPPGG